MKKRLPIWESEARKINQIKGKRIKEIDDEYTKTFACAGHG